MKRFWVHAFGISTKVFFLASAILERRTGDPFPCRSGEPNLRWAFERARQAFGYRILQLPALQLDAMNREELQRALANIAAS